MYLTAEDMRARYGEDVLVQITDADAWDAVAIARVNAAIADAGTIVDGYVSKYYQSSTSQAVPPLLARLTRDIAFADLQRSPTDEAKDRRTDAMRMLEQISRGLVKLDEGRGDLAAREGAVVVPDRPRTFSRDNLDGF